MKTRTLNNMFWLVKREFWEHRGGFFWAPVVTSGVFLLLNLMGIIAGETWGGRHGVCIGFCSGENNMRSLTEALDRQSMDKVGALLDLVMYSSTMLIGIVLGFVVFFYCLGALYDDRRDRSLLFWKSLPISDSATVLSKVAAATLLAPFIAMVCGVLAGLAMLLMYAIELSFHGVGVWHLLFQAHPLQVIVNLVGSIPLYLLWALPAVGWLMLCSAWARSKPFLWAVVLPVATGVVIAWFHLLGTLDLPSGWYWREVFARALLSVFPGGWLSQNLQNLHIDDSDPGHALDFLSIGHAYGVLASPEIWIGAALGAAMLAAAIWLRRWRDDN